MGVSRHLEEILRSFDWKPHPEGMLFVETHRDAWRTVAMCLFSAGQVSRFHRVTNCSELWFVHQGSLLLHLVEDEGLRTVPLSCEPASGRPVYEVRPGQWQAASLPEGQEYALVSVVCAPPFEFRHFQRMEPELARKLEAPFSLW